VLTRLGLYKTFREHPVRCWHWTRLWCAPLTRLLAPSFGYGLEHVPRTGGAVVAANHLSAIDPPLIGTYSPRMLYYMAKAELLALPIAGELLHWIGAFAVRRGEGDRDAVRVGRWVVRNGHVVGMFMEGTRQKLGYPGPVHPGAAMIAIQEGVPVIPCGIDSFGWTPRNRRPSAVVWGKPLSLEGLPRSGSGYKEGAALIEAELVRLWREAAQAVADEFPLQLPDGSRRAGPVLPWTANDQDMQLAGWPTEPWARGPLGPVYRGP
jgi:1-acyl-sn-glycerol-3-phosphate acyltransferase